MKSKGEKLLIRIKEALKSGELPADSDRESFCKAVAMMAREDSREDAENMLLHGLDFKRKGGRPAYNVVHQMQKFAIVMYYETQVRKRKKTPNRFKQNGGLSTVRTDTMEKYEITEHQLKKFRQEYGPLIRRKLDDADSNQGIKLTPTELATVFNKAKKP